MADYKKREAGDLQHFLAPEMKGALAGIDALIHRVEKVMKTLNPQDQLLVDLHQVKADLDKTRDAFETQLEDFVGLQI